MTDENRGHDALWTAFTAALRTRDRSELTIRHYLSDLRQFIAWFEETMGESFRVEAVSEYDVRAWRDDLAAKLKPASVNRKLAALGAFYRWANEAGHAQGDPTRHVNGVAQQPVAPKALGKQALARILHRVHESGSLRDAALLELLAATGLRASEAAGLRIGDLDLGERHGWVTVRAGKGRKRRRVPLHARARRALWDYLAERGFERESALPRPPAARADEPLFLSQKGGVITPYAIWYTVRKYAGQSGVDGVTPHTFRHTVATRLVRDPGVDLVTAATFLGHARLDTTARYSQPSEEDLAGAAERLT